MKNADKKFAKPLSANIGVLDWKMLAEMEKNHQELNSKFLILETSYLKIIESSISVEPNNKMELYNLFKNITNLISASKSEKVEKVPAKTIKNTFICVYKNKSYEIVANPKSQLFKSIRLLVLKNNALLSHMSIMYRSILMDFGDLTKTELLFGTVSKHILSKQYPPQSLIKLQASLFAFKIDYLYKSSRYGEIISCLDEHDLNYRAFKKEADLYQRSTSYIVISFFNTHESSKINQGGFFISMLNMQSLENCVRFFLNLAKPNPAATLITIFGSIASTRKKISLKDQIMLGELIVKILPSTLAPDEKPCYCELHDFGFVKSDKYENVFEIYIAAEISLFIEKPIQAFKIIRNAIDDKTSEGWGLTLLLLPLYKCLNAVVYNLDDDSIMEISKDGYEKIRSFLNNQTMQQFFEPKRLLTSGLNPFYFRAIKMMFEAFCSLDSLGSETTSTNNKKLVLQVETELAKTLQYVTGMRAIEKESEKLDVFHPEFRYAAHEILCGLIKCCCIQKQYQRAIDYIVKYRNCLDICIFEYVEGTKGIYNRSLASNESYAPPRYSNYFEEVIKFISNRSFTAKPSLADKMIETIPFKPLDFRAIELFKIAPALGSDKTKAADISRFPKFKSGAIKVIAGAEKSIEAMKKIANAMDITSHIIDSASTKLSYKYYLNAQASTANFKVAKKTNLHVCQRNETMKVSFLSFDGYIRKLKKNFFYAIKERLFARCAVIGKSTSQIVFFPIIGKHTKYLKDAFAIMSLYFKTAQYGEIKKFFERKIALFGADASCLSHDDEDLLCEMYKIYYIADSYNTGYADKIAFDDKSKPIVVKQTHLKKFLQSSLSEEILKTLVIKYYWVSCYVHNYCIRFDKLALGIKFNEANGVFTDHYNELLHKDLKKNLKGYCSVIKQNDAFCRELVYLPFNGGEAIKVSEVKKTTLLIHGLIKKTREVIAKDTIELQKIYDKFLKRFNNNRQFVPLKQLICLGKKGFLVSLQPLDIMIFNLCLLARKKNPLKIFNCNVTDPTKLSFLDNPSDFLNNFFANYTKTIFVSPYGVKPYFEWKINANFVKAKSGAFTYFCIDGKSNAAKVIDELEDVLKKEIRKLIQKEESERRAQNALRLAEEQNQLAKKLEEQTMICQKLSTKFKALAAGYLDKLGKFEFEIEPGNETILFIFRFGITEKAAIHYLPQITKAKICLQMNLKNVAAAANCDLKIIHDGLAISVRKVTSGDERLGRILDACEKIDFSIDDKWLEEKMRKQFKAVKINDKTKNIPKESSASKGLIKKPEKQTKKINSSILVKTKKVKTQNKSNKSQTNKFKSLVKNTSTLFYINSLPPSISYVGLVSERIEKNLSFIPKQPKIKLDKNEVIKTANILLSSNVGDATLERYLLIQQLLRITNAFSASVKNANQAINLILSRYRQDLYLHEIPINRMRNVVNFILNNIDGLAQNSKFDCQNLLPIDARHYIDKICIYTVEKAKEYFGVHENYYQKFLIYVKSICDPSGKFVSEFAVKNRSNFIADLKLLKQIAKEQIVKFADSNKIKDSTFQPIFPDFRTHFSKIVDKFEDTKLHKKIIPEISGENIKKLFRDLNYVCKKYSCTNDKMVQRQCDIAMQIIVAKLSKLWLQLKKTYTIQNLKNSPHIAPLIDNLKQCHRCRHDFVDVGKQMPHDDIWILVGKLLGNSNNVIEQDEHNPKPKFNQG